RSPRTAGSAICRSRSWKRSRCFSKTGNMSAWGQGTGLTPLSPLGRGELVRDALTKHEREAQAPRSWCVSAPLLRLRRLALRLLAAAPVVLALELLDAAGRVHVLHLARVERVAGGADFDGDVLLRAARGELVAAAAGHRALFILGVNAFFHGSLGVCRVQGLE